MEVKSETVNNRIKLNLIQFELYKNNLKKVSDSQG